MRIGIGVSTGTEVVCAALVVIDDDGSHTVEYRTVSSDSEVNTDIGDLVVSAIELMASLAPSPAGQGAHANERREPDAIAVAHRTPGQATSVRSASSHSSRSIMLVPESDAAFAYLDDSGAIARYSAATIVDIGATGTTASIVHTGTGEVGAGDRTEHFSGDVINRLVKDIVHGSPDAEQAVRDDLRDDRGIGSARYRSVKEHLSTHDAAEVGHAHGTSTVDRATFDDAVRPYVVSAAQFVARTATDGNLTPEAVVLIGGGAHIPLVRAEFEAVLDLPVLAPGEPDTVLAKGAALLALSAASGRYPAVGVGAPAGRSIGRFSGAIAGALLAGGIVLAYGIQNLTPSDGSTVSPAGSAVSSTDDAAIAEQPIVNTGAASATATSAGRVPATSEGYSNEYERTRSSSPAPALTQLPSTTPSLHPAPDLPVIPWPARPTTPAPTQPETTTPVTPSPDSTTVPPPTESPGESSSTPAPTPEPPSEVPEGSTELEPPTPSAAVPTTEVNGTPHSPDLSPPATVWTPPPPANSGSSDDEAGTTPPPASESPASEPLASEPAALAPSLPSPAPSTR